jgi:ABC-2 type transport system ATP-binding protein
VIMPERLAFRNVGKTFGSVRAVENVSFLAEPGDIIGILGLNGSGKSTALRLAATALTPDSGSVTLFADQGVRRRRDLLKRIGMLSDFPAHWEHLTAWDNAYFFARSYGMPEDAAVSQLNDLFSRFGLADRRTDPVSTYSYGMKRKLGIIETFAHRPDLVLLDEPSMGLDFSSRMTLHACIRDLAGNGVTVIFATNDVYEARSLGHKVLLLDRGRIAGAGTPEQLIRELGDLIVIELRLGAPIPLDSIREIAGVTELHIIEDHPGRTRIGIFARLGHGDQLSDLLAAVATRVIGSGGIFLGIDIVEPTLGDVLIRNSEQVRP